MEETKRQKQVAQLILEELNHIFLRHNLNMRQGGMVSIAGVQMTPDLLEARIYLSFFKIPSDEAALGDIKAKANEIRGDLGNALRHQLRRIPYLSFYIDDTMDHVFKMEELFKQINEERDSRDEND